MFSRSHKRHHVLYEVDAAEHLEVWLPLISRMQVLTTRSLASNTRESQAAKMIMTALLMRPYSTNGQHELGQRRADTRLPHREHSGFNVCSANHSTHFRLQARLSVRSLMQLAGVSKQCTAHCCHMAAQYRIRS